MTDPGPFADCQSVDEIMALVLDVEGPQGIRELLAKLVDTAAISQQSLLEAADELAAAGLIEAAELVAEGAKQAPTARFWMSRQQHQAEIETGRRYWGGGQRPTTVALLRS